MLEISNGLPGLDSHCGASVREALKITIALQTAYIPALSV
jgi:hypothetical protein